MRTVATIAIADPSPGVRSLIEAVVRDVGCNPVTVENADRLPECDALVAETGSPLGRLAAERLRAERPAAPLVILSIYARGPETADLAPEAYLVKPFRLADLAAALRTLTERAS
jgi:CheY-like chemotaxis protein